MAEVAVSGCDIPSPLFGDKVPDVDLVVVPGSDPFAEAAELSTPPALAELSEYIDEIDIRFVSFSVIERLGPRAASGSRG